MKKGSVFLIFMLIFFQGCTQLPHQQAAGHNLMAEHMAVRRLMGQQKFDEAREKLQEMIKKFPDYWPVYESYLDACFFTDTLKAGMHFLTGNHGTDEAVYCWSLGKAELARQNYREALAYFRKSFNNGKNFYKNYQGWMEAFFAVYHKDDPAVKELETLLKAELEKNPRSPALLFGLGCFYSLALQLGFYDKKIVQTTNSCFEQSIEFYLAGDNIQAAKDVLYQQFVFHYRQFDYKAALKPLEKALPLAEKTEDWITRGRVVSKIGDIYGWFGEFEKAFPLMEEGLAVKKSMGDIREVSDTLNDLGVANARLCRYKKALGYFKESLELVRLFRNSSRESVAFNNIALVYRIQGEYPEAIRYFQEALAINIKTGNLAQQAMLYLNIGGLHNSLGDYNTALKYLEKSLAIRRQLGHRSKEAITLNEIGKCYEDQENYEEALRYYLPALEICRELNDQKLEGIFLTDTGRAYFKSENSEKAIQYFDRAFEKYGKIGDKQGVAEILLCQGTLYRKKKEYNRALKLFDEASGIIRESEDVLKKIEAATQIGLTYYELEDYAEAYKFCEQAISQIEKVRNLLDFSGYKAGFLSTKINIYKVITDVIYHQYINRQSVRLQYANPQNPGENGEEFIKEGFYYSELSRARTLLELIEEGRIDLSRGVDPGLLEKENALNSEYAQVNTLLQQKLLSEERDPAAINNLKEKLSGIEEESGQLSYALRTTNPVLAEIKYPEPVTIEQIRTGLLDDTSAMLQYLVDEDHILIWCITREKLYHYRVKIEQGKLEDLIIQFRLNMQSLADEQFYFAQSSKLYNILMAPVEDAIRGKNKLIIIPDEILYYLPFECLLSAAENPGNYLLNDFCIHYVQSATTLFMLKKRFPAHEPRTPYLLAFGDPVYGSGQPGEKNSIIRSVYRAAASFDRLVFSNQEVREIGSLFDRKKVLTGDEAKEEWIKPPNNLTEYTHIHFATHSLLNDRNPEYSGLLLTQDNDAAEDGFLHVREIFNLEINPEVVVLSACNTGLGLYKKGEGFIGLTRAWMYAGAPSLVVSLWDVNDESTAVLMSEFYRHLKSGKNRSTALREAKQTLMNGEKYRHPLYWAGFIVLGMD